MKLFRKKKFFKTPFPLGTSISKECIFRIKKYLHKKQITAIGMETEFFTF